MTIWDRSKTPIAITGLQDGRPLQSIGISGKVTSRATAFVGRSWTETYRLNTRNASDRSWLAKVQQIAMNGIQFSITLINHEKLLGYGSGSALDLLRVNIPKVVQNATGSTVPTSGWPVSESVMLAGDWINLNNSTLAHQLTDDAFSVPAELVFDEFIFASGPPEDINDHTGESGVQWLAGAGDFEIEASDGAVANQNPTVYMQSTTAQKNDFITAYSDMRRGGVDSTGQAGQFWLQALTASLASELSGSGLVVGWTRLDAGNANLIIQSRDITGSLVDDLTVESNFSFPVNTVLRFGADISGGVVTAWREPEGGGVRISASPVTLSIELRDDVHTRVGFLGGAHGSSRTFFNNLFIGDLLTGSADFAINPPVPAPLVSPSGSVITLTPDVTMNAVIVEPLALPASVANNIMDVDIVMKETL